MSYDNDFDETFGDFDFFTSRFMKRYNTEIDEILKQIRNGRINGTVETREINEPGVKGYIIQGHFGSEKKLEPFEPLKPSKRRPLPERPFDLANEDLKETREPLTDIFEEENETKIYVELPGEEKEEINLKTTKDSLEIKSGKFHKTIELRNPHIDMQGMSSKYKNGVLEITIPKHSRLEEKDAEKGKLI